MRLTKKSIFLILVVFSGSAYAEGYAGFKIGLMQFDAPLDDAAAFGFYGGSRKGSGASFEGEFTHSDADIELTTFAGYAAFRSSGDAYLKGKIGVLFERSDSWRGAETDVGASGGVGVGFRSASGSRFEIEYTIIEQNAKLVSFGFLF